MRTHYDALGIRPDADDEAIRLGEQLLELRVKVQGADHWEVVIQKWELDKDKRIAALSANKRAAWRAGGPRRGRVHDCA